MKRPCLAISLINPREPQLASSYLWCMFDEHYGGMHVSYCGMWWLTSDLVEPTPNMVLWRTGSAEDIRAVSGRMLENGNVQGFTGLPGERDVEAADTSGCR